MMKDTFGKLVPTSYKMSSKTEAILDSVEDITTNGDKVILFTKFRTCAEMIAKDIEKELKEPVLLYTGAENDAQRDIAIDFFKNTTTYNVLIGTEAMAEGLNLQCAKYVINIDQPDTLAIKTQRIGRARRAGSQFSNVIVYDMITSSTDKAHSKDEERLQNIVNNQDLTDALVSIDEAQRKALIEAMKS
jgi:superfamily II DNA/RNA helicase